MSIPNIKTRQLSLPEVLGDILTGNSATSLDSESGNPSAPHRTSNTSAKRPRKRHQPMGDTPTSQNTKKLNQQKTPPIMDTNINTNTNTNTSDPVELTPELKLLETRLQSKFDYSINTALEPIQQQLSKLASTSEEVAQQQMEIKTLKEENNALKKLVIDLQGNYDELKTRLEQIRK